jgi:hypothetical protein
MESCSVHEQAEVVNQGEEEEGEEEEEEDQEIQEKK